MPFQYISFESLGAEESLDDEAILRAFAAETTQQILPALDEGVAVIEAFGQGEPSTLINGVTTFRPESEPALVGAFGFALPTFIDEEGVTSPPGFSVPVQGSDGTSGDVILIPVGPPDAEGNPALPGSPGNPPPGTPSPDAPPPGSPPPGSPPGTPSDPPSQLVPPGTAPPGQGDYQVVVVVDPEDGSETYYYVPFDPENPLEGGVEYDILDENGNPTGETFTVVSWGYSVLPPIDAIAAAEASLYGQGTAVLRPFETIGESETEVFDYSIGSASLLPIQTSGFSATGVAQIDHEHVLGAFGTSGGEDAYGQGVATLRPLETLGFSEAIGYQPPGWQPPVVPMSMDSEFISVVLEGEGRSGRLNALDARMPGMLLEARVGARLDVVLFELAAEIEGQAPGVGRLDQPLLGILLEDGTGLSGGRGVLDRTLPFPVLETRTASRLDSVLFSIVGEVDGEVGAVGRMDRRLFGGLVLEGQGSAVPVGRLDAELLVFESGLDVQSAEMDLLVVQMTGRGGAFIEAEPAQVYTVNLTNFGMTTYDEDYSLQRVCRFRGEYYGISSDGLYLLGGEDDVEVVIETGREDFGSAYYKRLTAGYVLANTVEHYTATVLSSDEYEREFSMQSNRRDGVHTRRFKPARGVTSRGWGVRIDHVGPRFELHDVELVGEVLTRKFGHG